MSSPMKPFMDIVPSMMSESKGAPFEDVLSSNSQRSALLEMSGERLVDFFFGTNMGQIKLMDGTVDVFLLKPEPQRPISTVWRRW